MNELERQMCEHDKHNSKLRAIISDYERRDSEVDRVRSKKLES